MKTEVRLLISPAPAPDTAPKGTWQVDITFNSNLINGKLPLRNPLKVEEAEDVRSYLEEHASKSPFDADRADRCVKLLAGYGKALFDQLRLAQVVLRLQTENVVDATLAVEVVEECDAELDTYSVQGILWEHIEEPALWASWITVVVLVVSRRFEYPKSIVKPVAEHVLELWPRPTSEVHSLEKIQLYFNVLLVIARDMQPRKKLKSAQRSIYSRSSASKARLNPLLIVRNLDYR
ncbi:hypothetical protein K443DRAFT_682907 [Laccaria amethystina LaAM-08-1]|jgi:hypothetical protein|uniref:Uncharacterized protein n=1 Tax=Laccaria amethystina LaAM-08-1 TaxID=1095629 RepID=A0A0C9XCY9_9AGAR|nr:hypothetical protein K443DRAFT_682907 [Laccaria amethystina LaAM-08-1]